MTRLDEIRMRLATFRTWGAGTATRELHANAPDDIAWLLAEIERLTGEAAAERAAVVAWLRTGSDPRARGSSAWEESVGDVLREAATEIERGEHRRTA
jgi:hypothetical protein